MKRLLFLAELEFVATLWWQTRFNPLVWMPAWTVLDNSIDYLTPFIYLSDMLFGLVLVLWVIQELQDMKYQVRKILAWIGKKRITLRIELVIRLWRRPEFWFGLLLVAGVISIINNGVGIWGWYRWLKLLEGGLVAWWVAKRWADGRRRNWYVGILLAGLGLEGLLLMGEWFQQSSLGWQWIGEWSFGIGTPGIAKVILGGQKYLRPMGTFAHANIAAAVLVVVLPLAWWWATEVRNLKYEALTWNKWQVRVEIWRTLQIVIGWGWVILTVMAVGVSFSRAAWVAGVGIGLWLVIGRWWICRSPKSRTRALMAIDSIWLKILAVGGLAAVGLLVAPTAVARFESLATTDSWSASLRLQLMGIAWRMCLRRPWGVGINNFTLELARNQRLYQMDWWQPVHNVWLLVLAEMGWLGLLGLLGLLVTTMGWLIKACWMRRAKVSMGTWVLLGVWGMVLVLSMLDHYWWTSQQAFLAVWGLGGGTWLYKTKIQEPKCQTKL